ncbi:MAG TPA: pilus assembly protein N-terminal domain-containing protein, partial [Thermoanaerobaculia bacterium]|nr:pilus assembly protein N-terminal domain-containing protein [Thermoanaerobaculia bacterium]
MKQRLAFAAIVLAIASAALAADYTIAIAVGESTTIDLAGATAAYAIDPTIADAAPGRGGVSLVGRAAGSTQVIVVTAAGTRTIVVTVRSRAQSPRAGGDAASPERGTYEVRYASAGQQVQTAANMVRTEGTRREEVQVQTSTSLGARFAGEPSSVVRSATYRITTPRRELTFFDSGLHHSPLTIDDTIVRGIHLRQNGLQLHAGYTMNASFGS